MPRQLKQKTLFDHRRESQPSDPGTPLAARMRPRLLAEFVGQEHLVGPGRVLRRSIEGGHVPSMILWGPPGSGKTTLASLMAHVTGARFVAFSAVLSGVKEIREVVAEAGRERARHRARTILFVDEIHRFNRAQQDAFLPHVEKGTIILVGATTENPSFEVISALLSRVRVVTLHPLPDEALRSLLDRALADPRGLAGKVAAEPPALEAIARASFGDARRALTAIEVAAQIAAGQPVTPAHAEQALQQRTLLYDKAGEEHYNVVSGFIKSLRGSDPDAAVYYLARMLEAGEDPLFVIRRMVIFAGEDVGNADARALAVAVDCLRAVDFIGMPEAVLPMTMAATYLALAPKSNSALKAYAAARDDVRAHGSLPVPMKLRNAPTPTMKSLGYGAGYRYPHDFEGHYVPEEYLPDALRGRHYYEPADSGEEAVLARKLAEIRRRRG